MVTKVNGMVSNIGLLRLHAGYYRGTIVRARQPRAMAQEATLSFYGFTQAITEGQWYGHGNQGQW